MTTYNGSHYILYNGSTVASSGVKKVILPRVLDDSASTTWAQIAISDGTFVDGNAGTSSTPNSAYGQVIASGKACTVLENIATGETGYTTFWAIDGTTWRKASPVTAVEQAPFYGEYSGVIGYQFAKGAKDLAEVVVPASVTLKLIEAEAFSGCSALKTINVKGAVSSDLVIEANAFSGVSGLTINVYSELDKANMENALATAGVSDVTVVSTKEKDDNIDVQIDNVISYDAFSLRTEGKNGLRALFSFNETLAAEVAVETGYTLVEYGALAASAAQYELAGDPETLLAAANGKSVQRLAIFATDGTGLNRYVNFDKKEFCVTLTGFTGDNMTKAVYLSGYAIWTNGADTVITFSEPELKSGEKVISLYDLTLSGLKQGIFNSYNLADEYLWGVLDQGIVTLMDFKNIEGADVQYTVGEGGFTFNNIPVRKLALAGPNSWTIKGANVEDVPTTGLVWSLLRDGDNYVAVYRRDTNAAPEGVTYDYTMPTLNDKYAPFAFDSTYYQYVGDENVTNKKLYTPVLNDEDAKKIKTLVIDYGVEKIDKKALDVGYSSLMDTVVYPDGIAVDQSLFESNDKIKNFIRATVDKSYLEGYDCDTLIDLTGVTGLKFYSMFHNASAVENILLPADGFTKSTQTVFAYASSIKRVWTVGYDMPEAGVIDFSHTGYTEICKGFFRGFTGKVIMPEAFTKISNYAMYSTNQKTDANRWNIFGDNSSETKITVEVQSWEALNVIANTYFEAILDPQYTDHTNAMHTVDYLKITYNGVTKTVLDWRADFPAQPAE